jgi:hypothetical protein
VRWYNHDHRHSGIRYVSPAQRHAGEDQAILAARHALYQKARDWLARKRVWRDTQLVANWPSNAKSRTRRGHQNEATTSRVLKNAHPVHFQLRPFATSQTTSFKIKHLRVRFSRHPWRV